jgi:hypothetical protein
LTDLSAPPSAEVTARVAALEAPAPPIAPATPSDARRRLDLLIADRDFGARLLAGHVETKAEWDSLQALAAKADVPPESTQLFSTTTDGALPARDVQSYAADLRALGFGDTALAEAVSGKGHSAEDVFLAQNWKARAFRDPEFIKALDAGHPDAVRRWKIANHIIVGGVEDAAK